MIISSGLGTASGTKNGGGVSNFTGGTLVVLGSLFSGNSAGGTGGGLYLNSGTVTLTNVTFSGNQTNTNGGGIRYGGTSLTMNNVTVTNNTADGDADGAGNGGGVYRISGTASFRNTLIAGNIDNSPTTKHPDCSGTWTSQGYNLVGNDTGCTFTTQTGDQRGTSGSPIDAKLGALQNNGGPTLTHAPLAGSPAIDAGNPAAAGSGGAACEITDQRGYSRPADGDNNGSMRCDIGAYEVNAVLPTRITYTYDPLYRLTAADYSTGPYFRYTYDGVGNRLTQATITNTTVYTYDIANRLTNVGAQAYTWDNNGDLLNDGVFTYTYDFANRLSTLKQGTSLTYTYNYNGLGDRVKQVVNGVPTTYTLDLNAGLTQVLADGTNTYLYGNGRIAQYAGATPAYFLPDALGSVRQLTNSAGQVTLAKSYQPYGSMMSSAGASSSMYGFAGEQTDATNLIFLRARYYGSQWGRFLTADTWPGNYRRPLSLNRWLYTEGNPITRVDPDGHFSICAAGFGATGSALWPCFKIKIETRCTPDPLSGQVRCYPFIVIVPCETQTQETPKVTPTPAPQETTRQSAGYLNKQCKKFLEDIRKALRDVKGRYQDWEEDRQGLHNPGHIGSYEDDQGRLKDALKKWSGHNCGDLPDDVADAWDWMNKPLP